MQGGGTSLSLTALLCVGTLQSVWVQVQTGILPKPSIRADPRRFFTTGSSVTIWCQGPQPAHGFRLYTERFQYGDSANLQNPRQWSASFKITDMDRRHAGKFQCDYYISGDVSRLSDPLLLVLTGEYHPPQLSIQPSPLVASGKKVSLTCRSTDSFHTFHLLKEGTDHKGRSKGTQFSNSLTQAVFLVDPVSPSSGGTYRCYGSFSNYPNVWSQPSNPVDLMVSEVHRKPSLTASPHSPVMVGANLTLQCRSKDGFDKFALTKDWPSSGLQLLPVQPSPNFTLAPVVSELGGQYRCYGGYRLSYEWSAPSEPVDILVAASDDKPSLSAHPGPSVAPGLNVTLQCRSSHRFDTVYWFKEDINHLPQPVHSESPVGSSQANFTMSPVTSVHEGTYRCYTAHSKYLLSQPSDPLELVVSGGLQDQYPSEALKEYVQVLIWVSAASIVLLLLFLLLFVFIRHRRQRKRSAAVSKARDLPTSVPSEDKEAE
ncbi:leukocyte immunoglobulin-like receptor subfamily B member 3 [Tenrec ecaudatus]|uniref:leukocyte immunoglobulin-like receptor subfamily B member 3 n=1 Tax=Tenrec ecaudatus TaxID=94439 RepID=UPI003F597DD1